MKRRIAENGLFYVLAVAMAWALKSHYSSADGAELDWILAPTAKIVCLATGVEFSSGGDTGLTSADGNTVIAPACAGINFLLICFCMLVFTQVHRMRTPGGKLALILASGLLGYGLTVVVNAARIALSMSSCGPEAEQGWFTPEGVHRAEGIAVYFLALSVLYRTAKASVGRIVRKEPGRPADGSPAPSRQLSLLVPLFWYLLITLGIPLLRASYRNDPRRFVEHGCFVVLLPVLILLVLHAARRGYSLVAAASPKSRLALALPCIALPALAYMVCDFRPSTDTGFDKGRNGLWTGRQWYTGSNVRTGMPVSRGELDAFAESLRRNGIRYAYVRSGEITPTGGLDGMPGPVFFRLRDRAPDVRFLPWFSGNADELPLHDPRWRERVIEALGRLHACGIDGVHLDIEPVRDRHPGYVELLEEIRSRFDGRFFVSHATRRVAPFGARMSPLSRRFWSKDFYLATMNAADQTVLMAYNTMLGSQRSYRAYVSHQAKLLFAWAAAVPGHSVLIGIPSYDHVPSLSDPRVENIRNASLGVRAALERLPEPPACFEGVSIYAHWTTGPGEWKQFRDYWLAATSTGR
ncbi:exosortase K [Verrucomicrobiota bacterium]